jgi:hypothetical protein
LGRSSEITIARIAKTAVTQRMTRFRPARTMRRSSREISSFSFAARAAASAAEEESAR